MECVKYENKQVLISNLEIISKELTKAEQEIGKEYHNTLVKSLEQKEITKEEFYLENALVILIEAIEEINAVKNLLESETPDSLVNLAKEEGHDFKELSKGMKSEITMSKLRNNPILGGIAIFEAMLHMSNKNNK